MLARPIPLSDGRGLISPLSSCHSSDLISACLSVLPQLPMPPPYLPSSPLCLCFLLHSLVAQHSCSSLACDLTWGPTY